MAIGAVPLVAATLVEAGRRNLPLEGFFVRKEIKDHGTARKIDGRFSPDRRIALVEDVVTTGDSTIQAIDAVEAEGARVSLVVTVVDRQEDEGLARIRERVDRVDTLATKAAIIAAAEGLPK